MWVRERRPEQRIQAQAKAQKEEKLGRVKQGCKASSNGAKERTRRSGMSVLIFHLYEMKDKEHKKRILLALALAFLEQIEVHLRDLLQ